MKWHYPRNTLWTLGMAGMMAAPAMAQPPGLSVTPMTIEADVRPGVVYNATIRVAGEAHDAASSQSTARVRVYAMDWTMLPDGTPCFQKAGTLNGCCSSWVEVNPAEFDLKPGQTQAVRYTLRVPREAQGTYHTVIMFEAGSPPSNSRREGMAIVGRVGSILYATAGPHHKSGRVIDFRATARGTLLTVENDGADHLRLTGIVHVKDAAGKLVRQETLPPAVVLPREDNRRRIALDWAVLPAGSYTVTAIVDYGGNELLGSETRITVP